MVSVRRLVVVMLALAACFTMTTGPAAAESGSVLTTDGGATGGRTSFEDLWDRYKVCDLDEDGMRVVGWISVKQADGSWSPFARLEAVGSGNCASRDVDVTREEADLMVVACRQNGASAPTQDCGTKILAG